MPWRTEFRLSTGHDGEQPPPETADADRQYPYVPRDVHTPGLARLQHVHAAGNAHRISVDQDLYHAVVFRRFGLRGEPSRVRGATSSSATDELQTASDALHIRLRLSMMKFRRVFDSIRYGVLVRAHACMSV